MKTNNTIEEAAQHNIINKSVTMNAPALKVWDTLTNPILIQQWMVNIEVNIISEWKVGSPIIFRGDLHGISFENKGTITQFEPGRIFEYDYWSSLSQQEDKPENYSLVTFTLTPTGDTTVLTLTQSNFIADTTYRHFNFYWNVALELIKKLNER